MRNHSGAIQDPDDVGGRDAGSRGRTRGSGVGKSRWSRWGRAWRLERAFRVAHVGDFWCFEGTPSDGGEIDYLPETLPFGGERVVVCGVAEVLDRSV